MSNFNLYLMTALVFLAVAALFVINFSSYGSFTSTSLSKDNVSGIAVEHDQLLYVLNFEQQNRLIDWINRARPAREGQPQDSVIDVKKIIVYRFSGQPNLEITPLRYDATGNLLFAIGDKFKKDTSSGELKTLLSETYDQ